MALETELSYRTTARDSAARVAQQAAAATANVQAALKPFPTTVVPSLQTAARQFDDLASQVQAGISPGDAVRQAITVLQQIGPGVPQLPDVGAVGNQWFSFLTQQWNTSHAGPPPTDPVFGTPIFPDDPVAVALHPFSDLAQLAVPLGVLPPPNDSQGTIAWLHRLRDQCTTLATVDWAGSAWPAVVAGAQRVTADAQTMIDTAGRAAAALASGPPSNPVALAALFADLAALRTSAEMPPYAPADNGAYAGRMGELDRALAAALGASTGAATDTPLALFPVRLETRITPLDAVTAELRIRVYVDDIHIDAHDPRLTADEQEWSTHLKQAVAAGGQGARDVWAQTAARFGPARAAYLLKPQVTNEVQSVALQGRVTGGSFTLSFQGAETTSIAYNATAEMVQTALIALPTVGADNVAVSGDVGSGWRVTFQARLGGAPQPKLALAKNQLTGDVVSNGPPPPTPSAVLLPGVEVQEVTAGSGPSARQTQWERPAVARCLPDRWLAVFGAVAATLGAPISETLQVGPDPTVAPVRTGDRDVPVDPGLRWLIDFDTAVKAGMGLRLRINRAWVPAATGDHPTGSASLMVIGVRASDATSTLADLLSAHHYTDGLELVPHGTPTNNTPQGPAGMNTADPGFQRSFALEVGDQPAARTSSRSDGARLAAALGLDASLFAAAGELVEQQDQQAMTAMLWPTTWGYFLIKLTQLNAQLAEQVRSWAIAWVRPGGPLPTVRVGEQPYGVLPVMKLDPWTDGTDAAANAIHRTVRFLLTSWATLGFAAQSESARTGGGVNAWLERRAVSGDVRARLAAANILDWLGPDTGLFHLTPGQIANFVNAVPPNLRDWGQALGFTGPLPWPQGFLVAPIPFQEASFWPPPPTGDPWPVTTPAGPFPLVREADPRAPDPDIAGLLTGGSPGSPSSLLGALARSAWSQVPQAASSTATFQPRGTLGEVSEPPPPPAADELHGAASYLAQRPAAQLADAFGGALDMASHRLDAWVTAFATQRLAALRTKKNRGVLVGGFGYVQNLTEKPPLEPVTPPVDGEPDARVDPTNAGYLHAPSLQQATTAAVLRSGYLNHNPPGTTPPPVAPFAIDLSSRRARLAAWTLDGVRQGQPLAALLGYRFERELQTRNRADLIDVARRTAPYDPAAPPAQTSDGAREAVRATDVVDGVVLIDLFEKGQLTGDPWTGAEMQAALGVLLDTADAVADGTLAEALHDTLTGNHARARSGLDAVATGAVPPPELQFLATPRTGIATTHRVLVPLPATSSPPGGGWKSTARARAEPALEAWAAGLLGDPHQATANVSLLDGDGKPLQGSDATVPITLDQIGLGALDLLAFADQPAELEQLAVYTALAARPSSAPPATSGTLDDSPAGAARPLGDVVAIARPLARLLARSRGADARDLTPPGTTENPAIDLSDLTARVSAARTALSDAAAALSAALPATPAAGALTASGQVSQQGADPSALASGLLTAVNLGVAGAAPAGSGASALAQLTGQAQAALAEITRRQARLTTQEPPSSADEPTVLRARLSQLDTAFGGGFTALPRLTLSPPNLLAQAQAKTTVDLRAQAGTVGQIYWGSHSFYHIGRANLDGTGFTAGFITDAHFGPMALAADHQHLYWANATGTPGNLGSTIGRANLDGSGVNQDFITGASDPSGVAVDDHYIYWANLPDHSIGRADLDGSQAVQRFIADIGLPHGLAVDAHHIYWANLGTIGRADLDGSHANWGFIPGLTNATGVTVDEHYIYWSDTGNGNASVPGSIGRANLDGTAINRTFIGGLAASPYGPSGIAVDAQHIYWGSQTTHAIGRANLDGTGVNPSFITTVNEDPVSVALADSPPATDPGAGPDAWLFRAARVREPVSDLIAACSSAEALGAPGPLALTIAQLPLPSVASPWAGQPFPPDKPPPPNALSLVLLAQAPPTGEFAALLVDEWTEVIPSARETTAIAYHYDAPKAQAPQTVLLAVPADPAPSAWTYTDLRNTVADAFGLMSARLADYANIQSQYGLWLPAIYLENGPNGETPIPVVTPGDYLRREQGAKIDSVDVLSLQQGAFARLTVRGENLTAELFEFDGDGKVIAGQATVQAGTPDVAVVQVSVDPEAQVGPRSIRAGLSDWHSGAVTVTWRPRADACDTASLTQPWLFGQRVVVHVRGHGLNQAAATFSGSDLVLVQSIDYPDDTQMNITTTLVAFYTMGVFTTVTVPLTLTVTPVGGTATKFGLSLTAHRI